MLTERQISGILRQIARQDVIEIGPEMSTGRLAALAYMAEQYGFEYGESHRTGGQNNSVVLVQMYRDPRPEARAREAATIAAYPQAGNGGAVPGMRQGSLKPLPEAHEAVARLKDRIGFDVMAKAADKRQKTIAWGWCGVLVLVLLIIGMPVAALAGGAALAAFLTGAFKLGEFRRQRIARRLTDAGFVSVQDEYGRQRFLRPGQQLPGHANPFAS
ncbi:hypothetical protein [Streptomyces antarcticus]|uniref:hypothetical protein n=1 Tax=Streptomyces antarcticus TaxID=2996458 RepID=UPI00226D6582|nr:MULTISPECIES: hypothetical protein [unclassified Streptomyces]MCY0942178.1 hypothetical protein [Streptomyces sp. H34-AA3]MCY0951916.1 hypothetical protein [Streptomyces sp. H27-S2]MCZ4084491.1 hypothetical protein [Streptomyces sp. H34-S5]